MQKFLSHLCGQKDTIKQSKGFMLTRLQINCVQEVTAYNKLIAIQEDDELALPKHTITQGWPSNIKEVPGVKHSYWTFREELTIEDGIILKGTRIGVPAKKWEAVLKLIHEGHLGLNKVSYVQKKLFFGQDLMINLRN